MPDTGNSRHAAVSSWFLGPRAENFEYLEKLFKRVLDGQKEARVNLYPQDAEFITDDIQADEMFKESLQTLELELETISTVLAKHSVPFWSPRYNAHMNMDVTMPSIIGCRSIPPRSKNDAEFDRHDGHALQSKQLRHRSQSLHHFDRKEGGVAALSDVGLQCRPEL